MPEPASPVPSPCTGVCRIGLSTGLCEGCFRTLDEIAGWSGMNDREKRAVWLLLDERRPDEPDVFGESPSA